MSNQNEVPVGDAINWTRNWLSQGAIDPKSLRSFLIPTDDFVQLLIQMNILQQVGDNNYQLNPDNGLDIRGYLGNNGAENKMVFVATTNVGGVYHDIIDGKIDGQTYEGQTMPDGSGIYDFTRPCPPDCDPNSPMI